MGYICQFNYLLSKGGKLKYVFIFFFLVIDIYQMIKLYFSFYRRSISDVGVEWCGKQSKKCDKFKVGM